MMCGTQKRALFTVIFNRKTTNTPHLPCTFFSVISYSGLHLINTVKSIGALFA